MRASPCHVLMFSPLHALPPLYHPPCIYPSAVKALGRSRNWELALGLWTTLISEGVPFDAVALHSLLRALVGGGQWQVGALVRTHAAPAF